MVCRRNYVLLNLIFFVSELKKYLQTNLLGARVNFFFQNKKKFLLDWFVENCGFPPASG